MVKSQPSIGTRDFHLRSVWHWGVWVQPSEWRISIGHRWISLTEALCLTHVSVRLQLWKIKSWQWTEKQCQPVSLHITECFDLQRSHFVQFTNYLFTHSVFLLRVYLNSSLFPFLCFMTHNDAIVHLSTKSVIISSYYHYYCYCDDLGSKLRVQQFFISVHLQIWRQGIKLPTRQKCFHCNLCFICFNLKLFMLSEF